MIPAPSGVRVWVATGVTDMRKAMNGLALLIEQGLGATRMAATCMYSGVVKLGS